MIEYKLKTMPLRSKLFIALCLLPAMLHAAPPATVTRMDWQNAVRRFNDAYAAHPTAADQREALQQMVDRAYSQYFGEQTTAGLKQLVMATESLLPDQTEIDRQIDALQVQVLPIISRHDRPGLLRVRVQPFFQPAATQPLAVKLVVRSAADAQQVMLSQPMLLDFASAESLTLPKPLAGPGRYPVELIDAADHSHRVGEWLVSSKSLDAQRVNTARLLSTTRPSNPAQWEALTTLRARLNLLSDNVDPNNPTAFLNAPFAYSQAITSETAAVMAGQDPYAGAVGDGWRGIPAAANVIPARLYVPKFDKASPAALLIALSEATQDENDWLDRLPNAPLQRFADETGTIVLVPRTISMLSARNALAIVIHSLEQDYSIDLARLWLLGHGVGAAAAVDLAVNSPRSIAKLALLGGGEFGGITQLPPTLQIVGKFDQQFDSKRAGDSIRYAQAQSLPVEQRAADSGHMLLVNDSLNAALHWLSVATAATRSTH